MSSLDLFGAALDLSTSDALSIAASRAPPTPRILVAHRRV